jgi:hypothetical protein
MMTRTAALLGASLLALTAPAFPALAQDPTTITVPPLQYTHRQLANGLNVYSMPDATAGTVTVQVRGPVGLRPPVRAHPEPQDGQPALRPDLDPGRERRRQPQRLHRSGHDQLL